MEKKIADMGFKQSHVASVFYYSRTIVCRVDRDHIARLDQACKRSIRRGSKEKTSQKRQRVIFVNVESRGGH